MYFPLPILFLFSLTDPTHSFAQVGPVLPLSKGVDKKEYVGHYISAGYTGHGMPRAFGWYVSFFSSNTKPVFLLLLLIKTTHSPYPYSAEAVASMIKAHIFGKSWDGPAWLPNRYLTWATEAQSVLQADYN